MLDPDGQLPFFILTKAEELEIRFCLLTLIPSQLWK